MSATHSPFGVYGFLTITALFFLLPLYVMLVTSFKELDEIRLSSIFALPLELSPYLNSKCGYLSAIWCHQRIRAVILEN